MYKDQDYHSEFLYIMYKDQDYHSEFLKQRCSSSHTWKKC